VFDDKEENEQCLLLEQLDYLHVYLSTIGEVGRHGEEYQVH